MTRVFAITSLLLLQSTAGQNTIVDLLRNDVQFSTLITALDAVGLSTDLSADGPFTFFAPTNDAFAAMTMDPTVTRWLERPDVWAPQVVDLLTHHVLKEELFALDMTQETVGSELYTLDGATITITLTSPLQIENTNIFEPDKLASNGVVHSIDERLFLPPSAEQSLSDLLRGMPFFSTFTRVLDQAGLWDSLKDAEGPITILAPTDEAFEMVSDAAWAMWEADPQLMVQDLLHHIIPGNFVEDDFQFEADIPRRSNFSFAVPLEDIVVADTLASNGILHIVDSLQRPPRTLPPTKAPLPTEIIGILRSGLYGNFTMLLNSLEETGRLRDLTLNGPQNPFTVFAPFDAAFVDLPPKFLEDIWVTHLINVLTYHIVRGNLMTQNFTAIGQKLPTLNFNALTVTSVEPPMVNDQGVTASNIVADNGMIHVIDRMLLPPSATHNVLNLYALFPEFTGLLDRIAAANLTTTFSVEGPMTVFSPVDGAFTNLLGGGVYDLEPEQWREILLYHIVPGQLVNFAVLIEENTPETLAPGEVAFLNEEEEGDEQLVLLNEGNTTNVTNVTLPLVVLELPTLQGSNLTVEVKPNHVNDAGLLFEDLLVLNGVVQVLDTVLIPPNITLRFINVNAPPPPVETAEEAPPQAIPAQEVPVAKHGGPDLFF